MIVSGVAVCSNQTRETVAYTALSARDPAPRFKREILTVKPPAVLCKRDGLTLLVIQVVKASATACLFSTESLVSSAVVLNCGDSRRNSWRDLASPNPQVDLSYMVCCD